MQDLLDGCRRKFGPAPRRFGLIQRYSYLYGKYPAWLQEDVGLRRFVAEQDELLKNGTVVWGALIQANSLLFSSGDESHPGEVVYCTSIQTRVDVSELHFIAHRLYSLKGTKPEQAFLDTIADYLTDELTRVFGLEVPAALSPLMDCSISTILFMRPHLPNGRLSRGVFPIIIGPKLPRFAMVLPSKYWPESLLDWWNAGD